MQITFATESASGGTNEDVVVAGSSWIAVLDGATAMPPEYDSGCVHSVAWLAHRVAAQLAGRLSRSDEDRPLTEILAAAIAATMANHADTCDLSRPDSPSTTVTMVRERGDQLDYLALCDSPLIIDQGGDELVIIKDTQIEHLPDYSYAGVSRARNAEGGFWVASTVPEAAEHAVSGTLPRDRVRRLALLSDGASRLVEKYGSMTWTDLMDLLERDGPTALIAATRSVEDTFADRPHRGKLHDDATAALITFPD